MKQKKQKTAETSKDNFSSELMQQTRTKEKYVEIFLFFLLLAFGIYQSIIYWGHQAMPHPDFSCFAIIAKPLPTLGHLLDDAYKAKDKKIQEITELKDKPE
jgi:disulfide bond formation protein DsbB